MAAILTTAEQIPDTIQDDRFIEVNNNLRERPPTKESKDKALSKVLTCVGCGVSSHTVRRRMCTGGEALCQACRGSPSYRVMSETLLRASAPWLDAVYYPDPVGFAVNCKHPAFRPQRMYLWADVAERCVALGVEIPE